MADITFSTWNGIKVGKGKVRHMTNPNSKAQQVTRKKRRIIGRMYEGLGAFVQVSVEKKVVGQSKFSQLLKQVNHYVTVANDLTVSAQYTSFPYSIGTLDAAPASNTATYANNNVTVEVAPSNAITADELYIVEFNKETGTSKVYATGETRPTSAPVTITYPPLTTGTGTRYVYVVYISANQTKSSNTASVGSYQIS
jgi:hypothetical protein